ncbi:pyruvate dehydrogenase (acetyl-transferring) E1 component subunit alpha [Halorubrum halophilum]|uniref:pyruvate dehydrogenase (acetyl-transferring) E1 component subunit alpha n=1 Tax=Halorubrum halophilum TaxID=413816 RepID=UPI0006784A9C|nr:pyruvate dehydrogenase (acetyl-transferring) E1 component subunit alpha [Halorubrum halophilum]
MSVFDRAYDDPVRVLDEDGEVVGDVPDLDDEELVGIYRHMRLARHFDERAVSLQRQGRMGTYPPLSGQEGAQIGSATALAEGDWIVPSYREHGAALVRGLPLKQTLLYWMGHEAGNATPEDVNVFPVAVPIASQVPHATGASWASKLRGTDEVFLCYFGDGATSEGDFHEGVNFAGVFDTPTVFFCNNNQWAISVPRERQTRSATLAQKAEAYGIDGVQVDGMDPLAVYSVTEAAVEKARAPETDRPRPTLIEAIQYRFGAHTTADDPTVYRDEDEVERWKRKDPIPRLEAYLRSEGVLDDERVAEIETLVETRVAEAIEAAESEARPRPEEMFKHAYAELPPELERQYEEFAAFREAHGDEAFLEE